MARTRPRQSLPRWIPSVMVLLFASALMLQLPGRASAACRRLNESDSALAATFARATTQGQSNPSSQAIQLDPEMLQQFTMLDSRFPWLSQCLASVNYWDFLLSLAKNEKALQCWREVMLSVPPQELNDAYFREYYCPRYLNTTIPCATEILIPAIQSAIDSTSGNCCDPMKKQLSEMLGLNLASFVNLVFKHIGNVVCSSKQFKNNVVQRVTQTCGYALMTSFVSENIRDTILTALQVSNTQGCHAMSGIWFYTTYGMKAQFFANEGEEPLGVCFAPIDTLIQQVSKLPVVKKLVLRSQQRNIQLAMHFSSLFGAGRCLRGSLLSNWLRSETEFVLLAAGLVDVTVKLVANFAATQEWQEALRAMNVSSTARRVATDSEPSSLADAIRRALTSVDRRIQPLCFHLPNSFSCKYNGSGTLALPFPEVAASNSRSLLANSTTVSTMAAVSSANQLLQLNLMVVCWFLGHLAYSM